MSDKVKANESTELKKNAIGTIPLVFLVIAAAAPLGAIAANIPMSIGLGNGIAAPLDFFIVMIMLLLFSVGYTAMSRHITNAGAFYTYISAGLGKRFGAAAGYIAVFGYNVLNAYCASFGGFYVSNTFQVEFGIVFPWWVGAIIVYIIVYFLGFFGIEAGTKFLMVCLTLELSLVACIDVAVLVEKGPGAFPLDSWSIDQFFNGGAGAPGLAIAFAFLSFIGFEATAIFGEEVKDPKRTVARATYIAVIFVGIVYSLSAWCGIAFMGSDQIVATAQGSGAATIYQNITDQALPAVFGHIYNWLVLTSFLAAWLSAHNMAARYLYAFGRNHLLPHQLSYTHPHWHSPHVAGLVQMLFTLAIVIPYAVLGLDPTTNCGAVWSAVAVTCIIFVEFLVTIAVIPYFAKHNKEEGYGYNVWTTKIAPAIATVILGYILFLVVSNFSLLTGSGSWVINSLPVLILLIGVVGFIYATHKDKQGKLVDPCDIAVFNNIEDEIAADAAAKAAEAKEAAAKEAAAK